MESLQDLLQDELKDIYDAEKQLTKSAKKSSSEEVRGAFEEHLFEHGVESTRTVCRRPAERHCPGLHTG
jgi:ferritin-like metal-binding protein YciE